VGHDGIAILTRRAKREIARTSSFFFFLFPVYNEKKLMTIPRFHRADRVEFLADSEARSEGRAGMVTSRTGRPHQQFVSSSEKRPLAALALWIRP
jgi:hypothetical protein